MSNQGRFLELETGEIVWEPPYPEARDGEVHIAVEYPGIVREATRHEYLMQRQDSEHARLAFKNNIVLERARLWDKRAAALSAVGIEDPALILGSRP